MADKILKVKWLVADKRLIKFVDPAESYTIAEDVDIEGIDVGSLITIELKDSVIVKLKKEDVKGKEKPAEKVASVKEEKPEPTEPQDCPEEVKIKPLTMTISAIAFEKGVVKFAEQETEKYWYPIAPEAKDAFKGLRKGDSIQVVIGNVDAESQAGEKYQKDGIVQAKAVAVKEDKPVENKESEAESPEPKKTEGKSEVPYAKKQSASKSTNESIERQVALKEACILMKEEIRQGKAEGDDKFTARLKFYTRVCFEAIQDA